MHRTQNSQTDDRTQNSQTDEQINGYLLLTIIYATELVTLDWSFTLVLYVFNTRLGLYC